MPIDPKPDQQDSNPLDASKSNRREFLKGKSALNALRSESIEKLRLPVGVDAVQSAERQSAYLEQYSKNAMACEFEISFNMHQHPQSSAAAMLAFELIDKIEDQMTVYRDHSEVSQLNGHAANGPVLVDHHLFSVLELAHRIYQKTDGAFDITSSPLTKLWGFDQRNGKLPDQAKITEALNSVGARHLVLDSQNETVTFKSPSLEIDLGGIGKGHALDRVADLVESKGVVDFVIHGGQSSVLARGSSVEVAGETNSDDIQGWTVGVSHPTLPGVRLGEVRLNDQALGTSGTGRQGFFHQGKRYGHIIDPRTGWPASDFLSTTAISESAAQSDALATAFFVMPIEEIDAYCQEHSNVGAILVLPGATNRSNTASTGNVEIVSLNLTAQQWKTTI